MPTTQTTLARYQHAPDDAFDVAPGWLFNGMAEAFRGGAARLAIAGEDPALLAGQDPQKLSRANKARSLAYRPALELITGFAINWCVIAAATPAWAKSVFPGLPEAEAVDKPVARHLRLHPGRPARPGRRLGDAHRRPCPPHGLPQRAALPRAEILGPGHRPDAGPCGGPVLEGRCAARRGTASFCNANIPTEEVFTAPHKDMVDGIVLLLEAALLPGLADRRHQACASSAAGSSRCRRKRARMPSAA